MYLPKAYTLLYLQLLSGTESCASELFSPFHSSFAELLGLCVKLSNAGYCW